MTTGKEMLDNYQSILHIDDKTKFDALDLFNQYISHQELSLANQIFNLLID
jgi:hypothetical protein